MKSTVFLVTPPFTQLNTPYPATAYLKGFLNTKKCSAAQADLGLDVILKLFSKEGLKRLFDKISPSKNYSENVALILNLKDNYISSIDAVISFLQNKNSTLAYRICERNFLPEASRFSQLEDLDWAFGTMGIQDKARHLATLYLEDISDLIVETLDPHFGFSRYAERLGRSANSFDELYSELNSTSTFIDELLCEILNEKIKKYSPTLVAVSVPFPGNLYAAFKSAQYIKSNFPNIKIAMGGGFANTELRSVSDTRVFEFFDFITLDDGELPIYNLIEYIKGTKTKQELKRTFLVENNKVCYYNSNESDIKQKEVGTPDYSDLSLDQYLSVIEITNPMHRLWSDGRWNKLTLAHGCYWGKCTFCDVSLDYIKTYEFASAKIIVDRVEELIQQTGQNGFHFVDEAAPPSLMKEVALEIIRRKLVVVWWTNIRFEKSFTEDLCKLLAYSGCIAVSGGLEVASDRVLELIDKGVSVEQVTRVCNNFTSNGIMVHAYLMYGFPTQTIQETIDSLEVVRQLFEDGVLQSGFWHQFALTTHSPVGMNPEKFSIEIENKSLGSFANNDLEFTDPTGAQYELFSEGLKKSLFNYMHGICFEYDLQEWFNFKIPKTTIPNNYIDRILSKKEKGNYKANHKVYWLGSFPKIIQKKNKSVIKLNNTTEFIVDSNQAESLLNVIKKISIESDSNMNYETFLKTFEEELNLSFIESLKNKNVQELFQNKLIII